MMSDRWEYKIVQTEVKGAGLVITGNKLRAQSETMLNKLGQDGWECYHVKTDDYPSVFYLKRRK